MILSLDRELIAISFISVPLSALPLELTWQQAH